MTELNIEIARRSSMWNSLISQSDPNDVDPKLLRSLNFLSGQAGIYRDANETKKYTSDGAGIAVSFLHTGRHYPDDLSDTEIIYHYPETSRIGATDQNEIQSAKNAAALDVPIFVISVNGSRRKVQIAKIVSWDDKTKTFLVLFNHDLANPVRADVNQNIDALPFSLTSTSKPEQKLALTNSRTGQPSFKFHVFKRYGPACAVCDLKIKELLQAAHIVPKKHNGSDDPRNGIVLCANHHLAYDNGLFNINPETKEIVMLDNNNFTDLGITHLKLEHLINQPHIDALKWRWSEWRKK